MTLRQSETYKQYYERNREKLLARRRESKYWLRPEVKARQKAWNQANREAGRFYNKFHALLRRYGLTLDKFHSMFENQNEQCAICSVVLEPWSKGTAVDHNHSTGKVRALLCGNCNLAIGNLQDSPELCTKAAKYLEKHNAN